MHPSEPNPTTPNAGFDRMQRLAMRWSEAQPAVHAFIASVVRDHHDAEEILQRTAAAAVGLVDRYDPDRPFEAWAIGLAKMEIRKDRSRAGRAPHQLSDDAVTAIEAAYAAIGPESAEIRTALRHCLERLQSRARTMLEMHHVSRVGADHIATELKTSTSAVYTALHRTRTALRECVERRLGAPLTGAPTPKGAL